MTADDKDWIPEIEHYGQSARRVLETAQVALSIGDYMSSINRSYYAAFYAANALLATLGLQRSKHSAVRAILHERFIKSGLIEARYGGLYNELFNQRMKSDYEIMRAYSREEAQAALDAALAFVVRVEQFLAAPPALPLLRESSQAYASPRLLGVLQPTERAAIQAFVTRLSEQCGDRIVRVYLFGSKARGDSGPDSDIDLLIVSEVDDWQFQKRVFGLASAVDLEYDVLLNMHLVARERWEDFAHRRAALWLNVQRDGIQVWGCAQS